MLAKKRIYVKLVSWLDKKEKSNAFHLIMALLETTLIINYQFHCHGKLKKIFSERRRNFEDHDFQNKHLCKLFQFQALLLKHEDAKVILFARNIEGHLRQVLESEQAYLPPKPLTVMLFLFIV